MAKTGRMVRGVDGGAGRRYELTDDGWDRIADLLPRQRRGGKWADHRTVLNGIFWVLNSGAHWRDMPERYGKWQTIYGRYRRRAREGLFDRILGRLHISLDEYGRIDWSVFDVDGSNVRAHRVAAGASKASKKTGRTSPSETMSAIAAEVYCVGSWITGVSNQCQDREAQQHQQLGEPSKGCATPVIHVGQSSWWPDASSRPCISNTPGLRFPVTTRSTPDGK